MADPPPCKKKRCDLGGWSNKTTPHRIKNLQKNKVLGDWRRFNMIRVQYVTAFIKWKRKDQDEDSVLCFKTPVPVGMKETLTKMEEAQNRSFIALPTNVIDHFKINKSSYNPDNFVVSCSFSEEVKYGEFQHAYCHLCSNKKNIKNLYWEQYSDLLPKDVSVVSLMENWSKLKLSWNHNDVLGCIIPNNDDEVLLINAKMILRPEKHWHSVHNTKKNAQKGKLQSSLLSVFASSPQPAPVVCLDDNNQSSLSSASSSSSSGQPPSSDPKSRKIACLKATQGKKKQTSVSSLLDPSVNFLGHAPRNSQEAFSFGSALNTIHVGVNCGISNATILKFHQSENNKMREYFTTFVEPNLNKNSMKPIKVKLNKDNIDRGINAIVEGYRKLDKSPDNPYRKLENVEDYSIIHDATTYFVKQMNTSIIRIVDEDGTIIKVPHEMSHVSGSLTGEVLCEELLNDIVKVKKVKNNAFDKFSSVEYTQDIIRNCNPAVTELQSKLNEATAKLDITAITKLSGDLQAAIAEEGQINDNSVSVTPPPPNYFKIATVTSVNSNDIHLEVASSSYPASVCGDSCKVNLKGQRLLDEMYGIKSPFSNCTSHIASGTIRRVATSETMCDDNVKLLYNNLRKILKHFSQSPKSTELLNRSLLNLEMNPVHMLVWAGTRMSGFLDACRQCSNIIVALLDALVAGKIREDESKYIMSPEGIFLLQLIADIQPIFADQYLHKTDSDEILSCQTRGLATNAIETFRTFDPKRCMSIYDGLYTDENMNICLKIKGKSSLDNDDNEEETRTHTYTLNSKVTRHKSLESIKTNLLQIKDEVLEKMISNIEDQVSNSNLMFKLSCFDVESNESFDERRKNLIDLFNLFGHDHEHTMSEKWNNHNVYVTFKKRIHCTEEELLKEFNEAIPLMNNMARRIKQNREAIDKISQYSVWKNFIQTNYIKFPSLCDMVRLMIVIPPNSAWVERAYSKLEQICQKRRNKLSPTHLRDMFLLAILKLEPKDCMDYANEIKIISNTV